MTLMKVRRKTYVPQMLYPLSEAHSISLGGYVLIGTIPNLLSMEVGDKTVKSNVLYYELYNNVQHCSILHNNCFYWFYIQI